MSFARGRVPGAALPPLERFMRRTLLPTPCWGRWNASRVSTRLATETIRRCSFAPSAILSCANHMIGLVFRLSPAARWVGLGILAQGQRQRQRQREALLQSAAGCQGGRHGRGGGGGGGGGCARSMGQEGDGWCVHNSST